MADPVTACLAGPAGREGIGLILHLGAGNCQELDAYLASDAARIVLVEPDPAAARALEARIGDDPRVQLHELALASKDGEAPLQRLNLPGLSSLRPPEALRELFPGLRLLDPVTVTTARPETLLAILPAPGAGPDVLVLDAPGEEATALDGLAAAGALTRFRRIFLHAGPRPLHAGSPPLETLRRQLEAAGYRLEAADASRDPDRPCLAFFLPQAAIDTAARSAELETALAEARSATESVEAARSAEAQQAAEAQKALAERLEAETCRATGLEAALSEATTRQAAEAETLEQLRADLSVALRLQSLRETDLNDLRSRHARLLEEKEKQDALLGKLTERLALAAEMLQRLELAAPDPAPDAALEAGAGGDRGRGGRKKKRKARG